jgi:hypothetical protein
LGVFHIPKIYKRNYKSKSLGLKPSAKGDALSGQGIELFVFFEGFVRVNFRGFGRKMTQ